MLVKRPGTCMATSLPKPITCILFRSTLVSGRDKVFIKPANWSVKTLSEDALALACHVDSMSKDGVQKGIIWIVPFVLLTVVGLSASAEIIFGVMTNSV